jgi:hypothetical protein
LKPLAPLLSRQSSSLKPLAPPLSPTSSSLISLMSLLHPPISSVKKRSKLTPLKMRRPMWKSPITSKGQARLRQARLLQKKTRRPNYGRPPLLPNGPMPNASWYS